MTEHFTRHCWEPGPSFCRKTGQRILNKFGICGEHYHSDTRCEISTTCMLAQGHTGAHEWTRDDQIGVSFR